MTAPPLSDSDVTDEFERLSALDSLQIFETSPEEEFDNIAMLASELLGTPIALVSLVSSTHQWFKARVGLDLTGTPREESFCTTAVSLQSRLNVPDASADERFSKLELVAGPQHVRAYAGSPLVTSDGHVVGTVCGLDRVPREFTESQLRSLDRLASQTMRLLELRRSATALYHRESLIRRMYMAAQEGETLEERVAHVLEVGRSWLGMDAGLVGSIDDGAYTVRYSLDGEEFQCGPGQILALKDTFCRLVFERIDPLGIAEVSDSVAWEHPLLRELHVQSYIGLRLVVDGVPFGTLSFLARKPRTRPFESVDYEVMRLIALWVSRELSRAFMQEEREEAIRSLHANLKRLRTLEGLLPICSWCSAVRDDGGCWHDLEQYVQDHSNAQFSHGLCPSCYETGVYEK